MNRMMKEIKKSRVAETRVGKSKKKSKFDLDGGDLTNYKLTHKGVDVGTIEDFE